MVGVIIVGDGVSQPASQVQAIGVRLGTPAASPPAASQAAQPAQGGAGMPGVAWLAIGLGAGAGAAGTAGVAFGRRRPRAGQ
jgi:hypothetical protein